MNNYYLGIVEFVHQERLYGRIRPLALVKRRSADDNWVVDREYRKGELGETDRVFWPKIPYDQVQLTRHYVRFKVEVNQRPRDLEREWHEFVVAEERQNGGQRRVLPLGLPIFAQDQVFGPDLGLVPDFGVRPGSVVFRRRMNDAFINGPWRVAESGGAGRLFLQPKEDGYVVEHTLGRLGPETFHVWDDHDGEIQMILLVEPSKQAGRLIDLLPDSALGEWLIRMLRRDKPLLSDLDRASPGWRSRVGELLGSGTDSFQRDLDRKRLARVEASLNALADDEARLADLAELPRFLDILEAAIAREVAASRGRIEAAALEETREFVGLMRKEREEAGSLAEREKQSLLRQLGGLHAEVADAERLLAETRAKAERDESSIRAAADHLIESRERIIRDFSAFQDLIHHTTKGGSDNGHHPHVPEVIEVLTPTEPGVAVEGPEIEDQGTFLRDRLAPTLASWGAEATRLQAKRLHASLVSCRWVAVPCPSWGVAYADAIGAGARYRIVTVEPTWLAFSDAWGGEAGGFWREAVERRDVLHLLIFADADRALVQCWARPLLDIVSGLRPGLPTGLPWPANLRLVSCPSPDEAALPVPDWVVAHWAGVRAASGGTRPDGEIAPGHVPFATWADWCMTPEGVARPSAGLGVASRSAALDRSALARTFRRLEPDDPERADEVAREVREHDARLIFAKGAKA